LRRNENTYYHINMVFCFDIAYFVDTIEKIYFLSILYDIYYFFLYFFVLLSQWFESSFCNIDFCKDAVLGYILSC